MLAPANSASCFGWALALAHLKGSQAVVCAAPIPSPEAYGWAVPWGDYGPRPGSPTHGPWALALALGLAKSLTCLDLASLVVKQVQRHLS